MTLIQDDLGQKGFIISAQSRIGHSTLSICKVTDFEYLAVYT